MDLKIKLVKILEAKKVTMSSFKFGAGVQSERLCLAYNGGGMVSCRLRATFLSNYIEL
jgi:hypothetical protein